MSRWRKISTAIGIALCIAVLVPVIHHYQLRFALAGYVAELKAKGEPMDLAQLLPPPVPPEQNGVPFILGSLTNLDQRIVYRNIFITNPPQAMCIVAPGRAMIGWQQPDIRSSSGTNKWEDLAGELTAAKNTLDCFQTLAEHPSLDFHLNYQQGLSLKLPHLVPLRHSADLLNASAVYNWRQNNVTAACANIRAILVLVKGQTQEPLAISQVVRGAFTQIGAAATWEILQDPNISEPDLALLQQDWQSLEFIKQVERTYLMERVSTVRSLERFRQQPDEVWQWVMSHDRIEELWYKKQWRWFWSYTDEKRALQIYQTLAGATRVAIKDRSYQSAFSFTATNLVRLGLEKPGAREDSFRIDIDELDMRWLFSEGARGSFRLLRRALAAETARGLVITAIALKRYELGHQRLPATLQDLLPTFIETIPTDWMDGQPLRYRSNPDGTFLLYSVGENGRDDGGNSLREEVGEGDQRWSPYWQGPSVLDWVWLQPATTQEIQKYYLDQSKKRW